MNNESKLYDDLTKEYKKFYEREPKDDENNNWKQKYDFKNLKNLEYQPVKSNIKSLSEEDKSDQKPLWVKLSNGDFRSLMKDVVNNLDDNNYKTAVNNHTYDLRNAKKFLLEITTRKISKSEALELYNDLIKGDIAVLEKGKGKSKDKRENILIVLKNLE